MTELARIYSRQANITVTASYDATPEQTRKIEEGASADVVITSHPKWLTDLKQQGLIDVYSITNLVQDRLALIASANGRLNNSNISEKTAFEQINLLSQRTLLVVSDPTDTALGLYSKEAIESLGKQKSVSLWKKLSQRMVRTYSAKETLYLIANGDKAGLIYLSNALGKQNVAILSVLDESLHMPIIYQAAVVAGENMSHARDFLEFLKGDISKGIFAKYGFIVDLSRL
jgi:molybdate transport system substrate-binding protein